MTLYKCPRCQTEREMPSSLSTIHKHCHSCFARLKVVRVTRGRSDNQKRSREQVRRVTKNLRMREQKASGSYWGLKSDALAPGERRAELKETTKKSYALKLEELLKLESECHVGELALFCIEFQGVHPPKRYVVSPEHVIQAMVEEINDLKRRLRGDTDDS